MPRRRENRWQRYRRRKHDRQLVPAMEEIGAAELDFLIDNEWLLERDAKDRRKVGTAITAMLKRSAKG